MDLKNSSEQDLRYVEIPRNGWDRAFFLAWDVGGAKFLYRQDTQLGQLEWNTSLMSHVFPQLERAGKPFLFVSSQLAQQDSSAYGLLKRLGEMWTHLAGGCSVRLWNAYGEPERAGERSHFVADFARQALSSGRIEMLTDGSERRRLVHLDDISKGLDLACRESAMTGPTYDLAGPEWTSVYRVAEMISEITGAQVKGGLTKGHAAPVETITPLPNWEPRVDLYAGLKKLLTHWVEWSQDDSL